MVRMRATLTLKPAGEFKDMHKTLIVAADFASAARGWYARWKILLNADVIHNDFGQGSVTLVADRGGAPIVLDALISMAGKSGSGGIWIPASLKRSSRPAYPNSNTTTAKCKNWPCPGLIDIAESPF